MELNGVLVAGIGNIFFRDDGFGPAVAAELLIRAQRRPLPDGVRVVDYGIRGMHLTYDLLDGVGTLVIIDAMPARTDGRTDPGSVRSLQIGLDDLGKGDFDAHGMSPVAVLASLGPMGAELPRTYLVGCVPADVSEGIGLSGPVAAAVDEAADTVMRLVGALVSGDVAARNQETVG